MMWMASFIQIILVCFVSFGASLEEKAKSDIITYLEVFEHAKIDKFGTLNPVWISDIKKDVKKTDFIFLSGDVFSQNIDKSRRSAFYVKDPTNPRIYINKDLPLATDLLVHEIFQDEHYEMSIAMSSLHDVLSETETNADSMLARIYFQNVNDLFDNYGIKSEYVPNWAWSDALIQLQKNNSILNTADIDGGDVSGGGGDQFSFWLKKEVLEFVIKKLSSYYTKEHPSNSLQDVEYFLRYSYTHLLRKVYIESDYTNASSNIEFDIIPDLSQELQGEFQMIPYFIKVPVTIDRKKAVAEIALVILQTMYRQVRYIRDLYTSSCACIDTNGKDVIENAFRCPNQQMHVSTHHAIEMLKKSIEIRNQCKLQFSP